MIYKTKSRLHTFMHTHFNLVIVICGYFLKISFSYLNENKMDHSHTCQPPKYTNLETSEIFRGHKTSLRGAWHPGKISGSGGGGGGGRGGGKGVVLVLNEFSEAMFYENYFTSDFHTNTAISRRVCLLIKSEFTQQDGCCGGTLDCNIPTARGFQVVSDKRTPVLVENRLKCEGTKMSCWSHNDISLSPSLSRPVA